MGQDLADVVSVTASYGKQRVAYGAFEGAAQQAATGFHVADHGLNGAAAAEISDEFRRRAAAGAPDLRPA